MRPTAISNSPADPKVEMFKIQPPDDAWFKASDALIAGCSKPSVALTVTLDGKPSLVTMPKTTYDRLATKLSTQPHD